MIFALIALIAVISTFVTSLFHVIVVKENWPMAFGMIAAVVVGWVLAGLYFL